MHKMTTAKIQDLLAQIQYLMEDDSEERGRSVNAAIATARLYNPDYDHRLDSMPGSSPSSDAYTWFWEKLSGNDTWLSPDGARLHWNCYECKYIITMA